MTLVAAAACAWLPSARLVAPPSRPLEDEAPAGAAREAWVDISHPLRLYGVTAPAVTHLAMTYAAERSADGDERRDRLTYGAFGASTFVAIAVRRAGKAVVSATPGDDAPTTASPTPVRADAAQPDLLIDLVRLAATSGLAVTRAGLPEAVDARSGRFDSAAITLQQAAVALPCYGFRLEGGNASAHPLAVTGLACGKPSRPVERSDLSCVLDGLDLGAGGGGSGAATRAPRCPPQEAAARDPAAL